MNDVIQKLILLFDWFVLQDFRWLRRLFEKYEKYEKYGRMFKKKESYKTSNLYYYYLKSMFENEVRATELIVIEKVARVTREF